MSFISDLVYIPSFISVIIHFENRKEEEERRRIRKEKIKKRKKNSMHELTN
jgi:hypothetical protein